MRCAACRSRAWCRQRTVRWTRPSVGLSVRAPGTTPQKPHGNARRMDPVGGIAGRQPKHGAHGEPVMPDGTTSAARVTRFGAISATRRRTPAPYDTPMAAAWSSPSRSRTSIARKAEAVVGSRHPPVGAQPGLTDGVRCDKPEPFSQWAEPAQRQGADDVAAAEDHNRRGVFRSRHQDVGVAEASRDAPAVGRHRQRPARAIVEVCDLGTCLRRPVHRVVRHWRMMGARVCRQSSPPANDRFSPAAVIGFVVSSLSRP